jgi:integrase/recombinase XerC
MSTRTRLAAVRAAPDGPSLEAAIDAFLAQPALATTTRRSYSQTLERLARRVGADRPLAALGPSELDHAGEQAFGGLGPATWNRHLATLRSFTRYCTRRGWGNFAPAPALQRRREPTDRTRAIPAPALERLLGRPGVPVRERALWRLLYESAGRASEVLGINVENVDLDNHRVRVTSKGGDTEFLHFQTASRRLLPSLIAGRPDGPLFLASRAPVPARAPAAADRCPHTGRGRLSYRRAEELFSTASGGWTLHQLRHSALTHLAELGIGSPLLMAKSRHISLRSLERYARPGPEAVAALTAATDPARRRRP